MPKGDPPVCLGPTIYEAWLSENPKTVDEGPIELEEDPDYDDENAVVLPARHVSTQVLPEHYADDTMIFSEYSEYNGIKFYVSPRGYDYLIRADQTHHDGSFTTKEGYKYGDYPHFHELNLHRLARDGRNPETWRIVTDLLHDEITPADLLEAFMLKYYLDDKRTQPIQSPPRHGRQRGLDEFGN